VSDEASGLVPVDTSLQTSCPRDATTDAGCGATSSARAVPCC